MYDDPSICPACHRRLGSSQGVAAHLSTARSCQWYKKGKMRALTLPGQFGLDDEIETGEVDEPFLTQGDEMIDTADPTQIVDAVPPCATWKKRELWFKNDPEDKHIVHHHDLLEAIKTLLGNPAHAEHVVYRPKKIFSDASKSKRIYNETWTGDWWNTIQDRLPSGACVAPVIIATDKTQLMQFTGGKTAYPVYLTLGNLPRALCHKPSQQACILIAYLSVSKMVGKQLTKEQKSTTRIQQLFHDSMHIILEPLIEAGKKGMEVTGGDGKVQIVYPILACYVTDYPKQCLITCAKYGTCPKCQVNDAEMGGRKAAGWRTQRKTSKLIHIAREKETSISNFQELYKADNISGGVHHPFWEDFPHCDIHMGIISDVLHQLYQGVVKHLEHWCTSLITTAELDHHNCFHLASGVWVCGSWRVKKAKYCTLAADWNG
ncbi:hypothetical protein EDB19DRAFT_1896695 [Suillus lakei]|nr:hypothetical protein EDB19DRAFT_1896695 [Suillus lakei]